jgi:hypothetical protein
MEAVAVGVLQMESVHTGLKRQALKIEQSSLQLIRSLLPVHLKCSFTHPCGAVSFRRPLRNRCTR